jgi:hypothetical protein
VQADEYRADDAGRVTASMLRRADEMCRRRLAREHAGGKRFANRAADARFAASNRFLEDARLAHVDAERVRTEAFVEPRDLEPEQRSLYRAAVRGYLTLFADRPGRSVDLGWRTAIGSLDVDLVGHPGLALELADGSRELRVCRLGGRRTGAPLLDAVEMRCALLRTGEWAPTQLRVVAVDLIEQELVVFEPDVSPERIEAEAWLSERVATIAHHAGSAQPRAGADCNGCSFVAGCEAHA